MSEVEEMAVFDYRLARSDGFRYVRQKAENQSKEIEDARKDIDRHETELHGDGGVWAAINLIREDVGGMRKAFYALTSAITAGTIALAGAILVHAL